ncbi:hypothetical protein [Micromonospora maritima]|uniref:hypothetical protein n=1 Tax=Micromonospora maritima TaxID=986711 RepID=UPI00157C3EE6|nr:hypothetical protein [Micromonospora maritima]
MTLLLEHGGRQFHVMAYHDAIRHDGPALELAELVNGELGPALVTVLLADADADADEDDALLTECGLPLPILTAFVEAVADERRRLREGSSLMNRESVWWVQ